MIAAMPASVAKCPAIVAAIGRAAATACAALLVESVRTTGARPAKTNSSE